MCIYAESKNCKAKVTILPLKKDLIINGAKPKKFLMTNELKLDTKSGEN